MPVLLIKFCRWPRCRLLGLQRHTLRPPPMVRQPRLHLLICPRQGEERQVAEVLSRRSGRLRASTGRSLPKQASLAPCPHVTLEAMVVAAAGEGVRPPRPPFLCPNGSSHYSNENELSLCQQNLSQTRVVTTTLVARSAMQRQAWNPALCFAFKFAETLQKAPPARFQKIRPTSLR